MSTQPKLPPKSSAGAPNTDIRGMSSKKGTDDEAVGFATNGYIDKKGTPYGDGATFNCLPPGMDITDQEVTDQRNMPMKRVVAESYPGDGWEGERDIPE
jgi:hypothetical protein